MSSHITLYSNKASAETVDKSGSWVKIEDLTGDFRGTVNVLNPIIQITPTASTTVAKILSQCNYLYIQELSRYYYVTNITCIANNLFELECRVDVLMSWKTAILAQKVIVSRNEKDYQLYLDDSALKVFNNPNICTYNFRDSSNNIKGFTAQEFVLALAGS